MPDTFAITTTATTLTLDAKRQGNAAFTVSNNSGRALRGRAHIVADKPAADWLTVDGAAERDFPVAGTQQFSVLIAAPADAPAGDYTFRLDTVGVDNPDEEFAQGPVVTFTVPKPPPPPPPPFPWWIVAVGAGALVLIIIVVVVIVIQKNCVVAPSGIQAWYPGDGSTEDLIHHNNGSIFGGLNFTTGEVGQAFNLNGAGQYVQVPNAAPLNPPADMTLDAWINPTAANTFDIVDKSGLLTSALAAPRRLGPTFTFPGYLLAMSSGQPFFVAGSSVVFTTTTVPLGTWSFVAGTLSSTELDLYVNGQLMANRVFSPTVTPNTLPLRIGATQTNTQNFVGQIDEVELFNRALSASEIKAIFDAGAKGKCKDKIPTPGP